MAREIDENPDHKEVDFANGVPAQTCPHCGVACERERTGTDRRYWKCPECDRRYGRAES